MVGLLCTTLSYALMVHLLSLREWRVDAEDPAMLHVDNAEEVFA